MNERIDATHNGAEANQMLALFSHKRENFPICILYERPIPTRQKQRTNIQL